MALQRKINHIILVLVVRDHVPGPNRNLNANTYYGALLTGRPIDGQNPQHQVNYRVLRGLPADRLARR